MKQLYIASFMFIILFFMFGTVLTEDNKISLTENRNLITYDFSDTSLKDLVSILYDENFEVYLEEQFFLRDQLLSGLYRFQYKFLGKREFGNLLIGEDGYIYHNQRFSKESLNHVNDIYRQVERLENIKGSTKTLYLIAPDQVHIDKKYLPNFYQDYVPTVYNQSLNLLKIVGVDYIDSNTILEKYSLLYPDSNFFYKGNPHWNLLASYIVADELAKLMEVQPEIMEYFDIRSLRLNTDNDEEYIKKKIGNTIVYDPVELYNQLPFDLDQKSEEKIYEMSLVSDFWTWKSGKDLPAGVRNVFSYVTSWGLEDRQAAYSTNANVKDKKLLVFYDSYMFSLSHFLNEMFSEVLYVGNFTKMEEALVNFEPDYLLIETVPDRFEIRGRNFFPKINDLRRNHFYSLKNVELIKENKPITNKYDTEIVAEDFDSILIKNSCVEGCHIVFGFDDFLSGEEQIFISGENVNVSTFKKKSYSFFVSNNLDEYIDVELKSLTSKNPTGLMILGDERISPTAMSFKSRTEKEHLFSLADYYFSMEDNSLFVSGWSIIDGIYMESDVKHSIIIRNLERSYSYDLNKTYRGDVSRLFDGNFDDSGFNGFLSLSSLAKGDYEVGLITEYNGVYVESHIGNISIDK